MTFYAVSCLAGSGVLAQQTFTYINGQNNGTAISITGTENPTTLTISSGSATQSGTISDSGTMGVLYKTGTGTIALTGADTYTGGTVIQNGTLILGTGGSLSSSGALLLGNSTASTYGVLQLGDSSQAVNLTVSSLSISGTSAFNTDRVVGGNSTAVSTLTIDNSTADTYAGQLGGSTMTTQSNLALIKDGVGVLTLTGTAMNIRGTTLENGTLRLGGSGNPVGATLTMAGGILDVSGLNVQVGTVTGTAGVILNNSTSGSVTLTLGAANATGGNYSGLIENNSGTGGTIAITKTGNGSQTLSGTNTYSGITNLSGGTLIAGNSTTLTTTGSTTTILNGPFGTGSLTLFSGTTLEDNGTAITLANNLKLSGTVTLGSTGTGSLDFDGTELTTTSTVQLISNTTLIVNNTTTIADNIIGNNFSFVKIGLGTLILTGTESNIGTGATTVTSGTLAITSGTSIGTGTVTLSNNTGLQYSGTSSGTLTQSVTVTGTTGAKATVSNTSGQVLTLSGTLTKADTRLILNANGGIIKVTGAIVSTGATGTFDSDLDVTGTVQLSSSNNSYSGPTVIFGNGTLVNEESNAAPISTVIYLGTTTTDTSDPTYETGNNTNIYQLNGYDQTIAGLVNTTTNGGGGTDTNSIIGGSGTLSTLTITGSATVGTNTFGGGGSNANNLKLNINSGSGNAVTLTGSNSYAGGTTVTSGALILTNPGASATGSGNLTVSGTSTLAGTGQSSGSNFNITGTGTTTALRATVLVGQNAAIANSDINTVSNLTLTGTGASTFTNANLVFNLSTTSLGQGNELVLGSTPSVLFNNTTLTFDLQGGIPISSSTQFTLLTSTVTGTGAGGSIYGGDVTVSGSNVVSGLTLTFNNAPSSVYYNNAYLELVYNGTGYNIDLETGTAVVPEPGTWALLLGGLGLLFIYRRKKLLL